jgi:hypothetical protein
MVNELRSLTAGAPEPVVEPLPGLFWSWDMGIASFDEGRPR